MVESTLRKRDLKLELAVARARNGHREARESVVRAVQRDVYLLALRFLWHPRDAEDASQEILVRVVTALGSFRGESGFRTWVYRVACRTLLSLRRKGRVERRARSFEEFGEDLVRGLDRDASDGSEPQHSLLLEEVRVGCTLAMLLCLDGDHRLAYLLGEIMELDAREAATALDITPAAFRKLRSRARGKITDFMMSRCGLVNPANPCRCQGRVRTSVAQGRVDPGNLRFASSPEQARQFPAVLERIRQLEETRRAAALYRSHQHPQARDLVDSGLREILEVDGPDAP